MPCYKCDTVMTSIPLIPHLSKILITRRRSKMTRPPE
uniref:Uncharacterized protein n=1 Tax=Anguilla anguilla TaxID=7936 RepID=A0A0E9UJ57_ANGAN